MIESVKIVSLNARGLHSERRHTIYNWLNNNNVDICLLQETYCTKRFSKQFDKGWQGKIIHSFSNSPHSRGVAILFRRNLDYELVSSFTDNDGRIILANIRLGKNDYSLVNIYSPNEVGKRITFLHQVQSFIKTNSISAKHLILGGDFNCVEYADDKVSGILDKSSASLKNLKSDLNLIDIWKHFNPGKREYTFIDPSGRGSNSRIDTFLLNTVLSKSALSSTIIQAPAPDHKAVEVLLKIINHNRGKGFWKLNNSILEDSQYEETILNLVHEICSEYDNHVSSSLFWEYLKLRIKQCTISYCIRKSQEKRDKIKDLENKIDALDTIGNNTAERMSLKQDLDLLYSERSKGYQIRSRAKFIEYGEKSTRYFF